MQQSVPAWKSFEDIGVTTITGYIDIDNVFNLKSLFRYLPITWLEDGALIFNDKKEEKNRYFQPGCIFWATYNNESRGAGFHGSFKNSVMIGLSCPVKNVNVLIYEKKIAVRGAQDTETLHETFYLLEQILVKVDHLIQYAKNNPIKTKDIIEWIKSATIKNGEMIYPKTVPIDHDTELCKYLLNLICDYSSHEDYCNVIDEFILLDWIYDSPLKLKKTSTSMVNHNFNFDFVVNRRDMVDLIRILNNHNYTNFRSYWNNRNEHTANVFLDYIIDDDLMDNINKQENKRYFTFKCTKKGKISLSGPHLEMNKDAYEKFQRLMIAIQVMDSEERELLLSLDHYIKTVNCPADELAEAKELIDELLEDNFYELIKDFDPDLVKIE